MEREAFWDTKNQRDLYIRSKIDQKKYELANPPKSHFDIVVDRVGRTLTSVGSVGMRMKRAIIKPTGLKAKEANGGGGGDGIGVGVGGAGGARRGVKAVDSGGLPLFDKAENDTIVEAAVEAWEAHMDEIRCFSVRFFYAFSSAIPFTHYSMQ